MYPIGSGYIPKNRRFSLSSGDGIGTLTPMRNREVFGFLGYLGGGFKYFLFSPLPGKDFHVD